MDELRKVAIEEDDGAWQRMEGEDHARRSAQDPDPCAWYPQARITEDGKNEIEALRQLLGR